MLGLFFAFFGALVLFLLLGIAFGWVPRNGPPKISPEEIAKGAVLITLGALLFLITGIAMMLGRKWPFLTFGICGFIRCAISLYERQWMPAFLGFFHACFDFGRGLPQKYKPKATGLPENVQSFKSLEDYERRSPR